MGVVKNDELNVFLMESSINFKKLDLPLSTAGSPRNFSDYHILLVGIGGRIGNQLMSDVAILLFICLDFYKISTLIGTTHDKKLEIN